MDTIQQVITAPSTDNAERLYEAYKSMPGNGSKSQYEFWLFMTVPSPERIYFLECKTKSVPEFADNLVMDKYEGIC